jgi:DNA-binding response OmpR family regulator
VIEDDLELRQMLQQTLVLAGYEVRTAADGKEAGRLCQIKSPDLVITDIYMPNKDGLEVIMDLRASFPRTKIIAMSGQLTTKNMLPVATTLGAARTLTKPFLPHELLSVVEEILPSGAH